MACQRRSDCLISASYQEPLSAARERLGAAPLLKQFFLATTLRPAIYEKLDVRSEFVSSLTEDPDSHIEALAVPIAARDRLLPHAEQEALDAITRSCL
jgi:hypothetical protein